MRDPQIESMQAEFIADFTERLANLAKILEPTDSMHISEGFPLDAVFRTIHSLKGTAGMFGFEKVTQIATLLETLLTELRQGRIKITSDLVALIIESIDEMIALLTNSQEGRTASQYEQLLIRMNTLLDGELLETRGVASSDTVKQADLGSEDQEGHGSQGEPDAVACGSRGSGVSSKSPSTGLSHSPSDLADLSVKVSISILDSMMELISELRSQQIAIARAIKHMPSQFGDRRLKSNLLKVSIESNKSISAVEALLTNARLVPLSILFERFRIEVRRLSRMLGKEVKIIIQGGETKIDRALLEKLYDPVLHIVRNAIAHGVETAEERKSKGKPMTGTLVMRASVVGNEVRIEIEDDGRGIDPENIANVARQRGMMVPDGENIFDLLFTPGFTTSTEPDEVSGRGVGLDAVKQEVGKLRGTVRLSSTLGKGTSVVLSVPLTMVVSRGLLIEQGKLPLIIPDSAVIQVNRLPEEVKNREYIEVKGTNVKLVHLGLLIGDSEDCDTRFVTIVSSGENKIGITSSRVYGEVDIVSKPVPWLFSFPDYIDGLAEVLDGRVGFVINPARMGAKFDSLQVGLRSGGEEHEPIGFDIFSQDDETVDLLIFRNRSKYYALPAALVKQVVRLVKVTKLPCWGGAWLGACFIRGQCYLLGWTEEEPFMDGALAKWVIALNAPQNCGVIAEEVERIVNVSRSKIAMIGIPRRVQSKGRIDQSIDHLIQIFATFAWEGYEVNLIDVLGVLGKSGRSRQEQASHLSRGQEGIDFGR